MYAFKVVHKLINKLGNAYFCQISMGLIADQSHRKYIRQGIHYQMSVFAHQ